MNLNEYIGSQIKRLRESRNMTQDALAEKLGTTRQSISRYESGNRKTNQDMLFDLSDIFNVSINEFFPDTKNKEENDISSIYNKLNTNRQIKVYNFAEKQLEEQQRDNVVNLNGYIEVTMSGYLSAGTGEYLSEDIQEQVRIPKSIVPSDDYDLVLQVNGDSMQPMFEDHEYIFVKKTTEIRSGQIGVFIIDGESYLKKAYIEDNHLRLVSLNSKYEDLMLDDVNDITVVGTVVM